MRITQGMLSQNSLRHITSSYEKMGKLQNQLSTGKKITRASDDPVVAMKSMQNRTSLEEVNQYTRNLTEAGSWLDNTETNITEGIDVLSRIRELVVSANNETNGLEERKAIGVEIGQLKEQMISSANSQVAGKYIFNGTKTDQAPIVKNDDGSYTYNFENYESTSDVNINVSKGVTLKVNSDPNEAFGGSSTSGQNIFEMLTDLENELKTGTLNNEKSFLSDIDGFSNQMIAERSDIGARTNRMELVESRLEQQKVVATRMLSDNEDVDFEKVITDLLSQESVHRAALSTNSRIIQPTLIDFLR
ncbi:MULTISPECIES: flagellar hook-associated protein FlgL [Bacillus]|uniref:Flagellar biosynthesis protein FlgL n=2 Tax=Bacillus TaxID=1386 RepID=A0A0M4FS37_9BACI|nr:MULTISPECIES: flagellar hook-associated protein FlgL [Bacillus]ALC82498.1 flagellar biosynthesis protein FlgL [Bacillus gobiensis]MBP1081394.1 flagellar hook-associated protein 3 FlgL [Bacillus capparidis]MED1096066.1 flagellar hook-associated protein FlgL [Bacillus capparidis]